MFSHIDPSFEISYLLNIVQVSKINYVIEIFKKGSIFVNNPAPLSTGEALSPYLPAVAKNLTT